MFSERVSSWFAGRFGAPTEAQRRGWPLIASGQDVLIAAPTGSGKTLAAFLWCIDSLVSAPVLEDRTYVVYVSPLKALSHDIRINLQRPLEELGATNVRVSVRTGDTPAHERQLNAKKPPHILVTTPESLYIVLTTEKGRAALAGAKTVIVDEIHALARDRRGAHLALSLERLDALCAKRPQRIGLSATQKPIETIARFLTGGGECAIVDEGHARPLDVELLAPSGELSAVLSHEQWEDVYDQIARLAGSHRTTIVFTNTRRLAERIGHRLSSRLGEDQVATHHGALARPVRQSAERRLREGTLRVMVATASLELGIDVGNVELVCQIGSPRNIATLLQRLGRANHSVGGTPKGRLFALTRDDLVECAALLRALKARRLDAICMPEKPLDVLAQQLVAISASGDHSVDHLFALARRAWPYRDLERQEFDDVLDMLADGFATRRGRSGAHIHLDRVGGRVRGRRGARLAAILSGGAIPDRADYEVVVEPEGARVGTLDEDFAIESNEGDIFLLGNTSWRVRRVEAGRVRVEDARGQPPTIPFWLGEAPGRTEELSEEVSRLRADVASHGAKDLGIDRVLAEQLEDYVAATKSALGAIPTQETIVFERFFDESGGMQLVVHAPFGSRINRGWGLALRKSFCRTFDFELQAAATDDGIILSMGPQHSFPLEAIAEFVRSKTVRDVLVQAILQAPIFETRWRWNAARSLAVLRHNGGKRVPPNLQRMRAADLLAAVFPAQVGCQDNHGGCEIEPPKHPLVDQTLDDCLTEAMDVEGLTRVLEKLERGDIRFVARDTPEPSPMSHAIINANPYAFLDDAPLEERRTRAVSVRRGLPAEVARELGTLDAEAIATVRREAQPPVRSSDELHDLMCLVWALPPREEWRAWFDELHAARRATQLGPVWVAAERLGSVIQVYGGTADVEPVGRTVDRDETFAAIVRGHAEHIGPFTEAALALHVSLDPGDVAIACARLESEGALLRGSFTPGSVEKEWCERRLLSRIHRLTLGRLRREIEPVEPGTFARFLSRWQHLAPGTQLHGVAGLEAIIRQMEGVEAPIAAWESEIFPARVADYSPALLDELCLSGEVMWGRRSRSSAEHTTRVTPIALWMRESAPWMIGPREAPAAGTPAAAVHEALKTKGALFYGELADVTGLMRTELDEALWALVASGRLTADGFGPLRALLDRAAAPRRRVGRWALLEAPPCADETAVEQHARLLLRRTGVVYKELAAKEILPPWRDVLVCLRRMEARGEIRGGRFVAGLVGEQFALPEALDALRAQKREESLGRQAAG